MEQEVLQQLAQIDQIVLEGFFTENEYLIKM